MSRYIAVSLLIWCGILHQATGGELRVLTLEGSIVDSTQHPLPGCLISVVSESARSAAVFSDSGGRFTAPLSVDGVSGANFFLEIYWNRSLVFRQPLSALTIVNGESGAANQTWPVLLRGGGRVALQPIRLGK